MKHSTPFLCAAAIAVALGLSACGDDPQKLMASAREYQAKGDLNGAVIQLKNVLQKDPKLAEARYLFGMILREQGDDLGAERELRKALELGYSVDQLALPLAQTLIATERARQVLTDFGTLNASTPSGKAAVLTGMADARLALGEIEKARSTLSDALSADPAYPPARLTEARLRVVAREYETAFSLLSELIGKDASYYEAIILRAEVLMLQKKLDLALADFSAAQKLQPRMTAPYLRAAKVLVAQNKIKEASAKLEEARKIAPNNLAVRFEMGLIALHEEKYEAARDAGQQVLRAASDWVPARLLVGIAQLKLREPLQAQEQFEKVVAKVPQAAGPRRLLSRAYLMGNEPSKALEVLEPILSRDGAARDELMLAGQAALIAGDQARSAQYFERAARLDPKDALAQARLGIARLAGGDAEQAVGALEEASRLDEGGGGADVALVTLHLRQGQIGKARESANLLLKKLPQLPLAHNLSGAVALAEKRKPEARAAFEKAIKLDPGFLSAATNLARMDLQDGKREDARKRFEAVIEARPKTPEAYLSLARFVAEWGKQEEVRAILDKGVAANPQNLQLRSGRIEWMLRVADLKAALAEAQEVLALFPNDAAAIAVGARAQAGAGDLQQAIATQRKLVQMQSMAIEPLVALAEFQYRAKDYAATTETLNRALTLKPDNEALAARLFALKLEQRKTDEALAMARAAQKKDARNPGAYVMEGDAHAQALAWPAASAAYSKALSLRQEAEIATRLYGAQVSAGKTTDAEALAKRWLAEHPKDIVFRAYLAERQLAAGRFAEAAVAYRTIVALEPKNAVMLNNLAWAAGQGKDPKAMSYVDQALELAPDSPAILDTKAVLLLATGKSAEAVQLLRRASNLVPDNLEIRLNYARALVQSGDKVAAKREADVVLVKSAPESVVRRDAQALLKTL